MKIFILILSFFYSLMAVEIPVEQQNGKQNEEQKIINTVDEKKIKIFGENLFNGQFSKFSQHRFNPDYILNIGDTINLKLWGAIDLEIKLTIDEQGKVFIPKVGTVKLLGVKNQYLTEEISNVLKNTYKDNVYIYANLDNFQPVTVFVSGGAVKPGLYEGLSSDSILQFLDKAKGIDKNGSYRNITVLRDNKIVSRIDLYEYLLNGKLDTLQFKTGDIINVDYLKGYITVDGDVLKSFQIEINESMNIQTISKLVQPNIEATDVVISKFDEENEKISQMYSLKNNFKIQPNQHLRYVSNNNSKTLEIKIDGEHDGLRNIVIKKGTNLQELVSSLKFSNLSSKDNIHLYRKSVSELQKQLIDSSLNELESSVLKTGSSTTDESIIRKQEASLVLDFIKRAKEVEPKGRIILNKNSDLSQIILEEGDTIFVPRKSHVVTVQGEVKIPSALSYVDKMNLNEYVELCGGLNVRADEDNILIIKQNGNVVTYNSNVFSSDSSDIAPGDSILILSKLDSKSLPIVKDITQIIYQIAVGAGVLIRL